MICATRLKDSAPIFHGVRLDDLRSDVTRQQPVLVAQYLPPPPGFPRSPRILFQIHRRTRLRGAGSWSIYGEVKTTTWAPLSSRCRCTRRLTVLVSSTQPGVISAKNLHGEGPPGRAVGGAMGRYG